MRELAKIRHVVESLSTNKEFGRKFKLSVHFWEKIEELLNVLKIPYTATVESQKTGYGLADFYISWLRIRKGLERIENPDSYFNLVMKLIIRLDERAPSLFKTPLMLCAIYLDPRINFKLNNAQKRDAAMALIQIQERTTILNEPNNKSAINDTLDEIQAECCGNNGEQRDFNTSALLASLANFEIEQMCKIRAPVKQFWKENGHKYPLIHPNARVIHSVPANQCCTERSFSSFSFIRSAHRMSMNPKNLSNALIIRLNKDLFYDFRKEQIESISKS